MFGIAEPKTADLQEQWRGAEYLTDMWRDTCDALSIEVTDESGPTVGYDVTIGLVTDPDGGVRTQYRVDIDAAVATKFAMTKRVRGGSPLLSDKADERFHKAVAIEAENLSVVNTFLTEERRAMFLQLMLRLPSARVTNNHITAWSKGIEANQGKIERTIDRLIEVAEVVRPSWVDVAVDEQSVLHDLFDTGLDQDGISERFEELYRGSEVSWSGELLQIGATDRSGQRCAVLIGSADGLTTSSGRVVALTVMDPEKRALPGDVVTAKGIMWNLDTPKRLFHIE